MGLLILAFGLGSILMMPVMRRPYGPQRVRTRAADRLGDSCCPCCSFSRWRPISGCTAVAVFAIWWSDRRHGCRDERQCRACRKAHGASDHVLLPRVLEPWGPALAPALGGFLIEGTRRGRPRYHCDGAGHRRHLARLALHCAGPTDRRSEGRNKPMRMPRSPLPYLIGVMALFSMIPEGSILDWGGFVSASANSARIGVGSARVCGLFGHHGDHAICWAMRSGKVWARSHSASQRGFCHDRDADRGACTQCRDRDLWVRVCRVSAFPTWCRLPFRPPAIFPAFRRESGCRL